jgi:hypothetical protein
LSQICDIFLDSATKTFLGWPQLEPPSSSKEIGTGGIEADFAWIRGNFISVYSPQVLISASIFERWWKMDAALARVKNPLFAVLNFGSDL